MRNFRELTIWKQAIELAVLTYKISVMLPREEVFGLRMQINKAVVSISANIAEGCSRRTQKDFARFLEIALGSAMEVENHLIVSLRLHFISMDQFQSILPLLHQEQKQINAFLSKLR